MSDFWSDPSSTSVLYVCEQRRLCRDCADAQARPPFAGRLCDKYHNLMSWLNSNVQAREHFRFWKSTMKFNREVLQHSLASITLRMRPEPYCSCITFVFFMENTRTTREEATFCLRIARCFPSEMSRNHTPRPQGRKSENANLPRENLHYIYMPLFGFSELCLNYIDIVK